MIHSGVALQLTKSRKVELRSFVVEPRHGVFPSHLRSPVKCNPDTLIMAKGSRNPINWSKGLISALSIRTIRRAAIAAAWLRRANPSLGLAAATHPCRAPWLKPRAASHNAVRPPLRGAIPDRSTSWATDRPAAAAPRWCPVVIGDRVVAGVARGHGLRAGDAHVDQRGMVAGLAVGQRGPGGDVEKVGIPRHGVLLLKSGGSTTLCPDNCRGAGGDRFSLCTKLDISLANSAHRLAHSAGSPVELPRKLLDDRS
jgi:hypothetical protein